MFKCKKSEKNSVFSYLTLTFDLEDDLLRSKRIIHRLAHMLFSRNTYFVCFCAANNSRDTPKYVLRLFGGARSADNSVSLIWDSILA